MIASVKNITEMGDLTNLTKKVLSFAFQKVFGAVKSLRIEGVSLSKKHEYKESEGEKCGDMKSLQSGGHNLTTLTIVTRCANILKREATN